MSLANPADVPSTPRIALSIGLEQVCAGLRFVRKVLVCLTWRAALTNSLKRNNWNYMLRGFWLCIFGLAYVCVCVKTSLSCCVMPSAHCSANPINKLGLLLRDEHSFIPSALASWCSSNLFGGSPPVRAQSRTTWVSFGLVFDLVFGKVC